MEDLQLELDFNWPPLTASRHYNVFSFAFIYLIFLWGRFVVGGFFFSDVYPNYNFIFVFILKQEAKGSS